MSDRKASVYKAGSLTTDNMPAPLNEQFKWNIGRSIWSRSILMMLASHLVGYHNLLTWHDKEADSLSPRKGIRPLTTRVKQTLQIQLDNIESHATGNNFK